MRRFIAAAAVTAVTAGLGAPALAAVSDDGPDPDDHLGATPAAAVEAEAGASASVGDAGDDGCHVVEETIGDDAVGGWTRTVVCVSSTGVSASTAGSAHAGSEGGGEFGDEPEPARPDIDPEDQLQRVLDLVRDQAPATGDVPSEDPNRPGDPGDDGDDGQYRQVVEDTLGLGVYEDEVCDDRHDGYAGDGDYVTDYLVDEYAHDYVVDCWADDYLVGDYARNYLLDYVDEQSPVDLGPAKDVARDLIDTVLGVTNAEGEEVPTPSVPDVPTPDAPGFGVPDLGTPDSPIGDGDDLTGAAERVEQLRSRLSLSP